MSPKFLQIGRIPNEWSRCFLPLVRDKKIQIEGFCKSAPVNLGLMDTINLSVRYMNSVLFLNNAVFGLEFGLIFLNICCNSVYINSSILHKSHQTSVKVPTSSNDEASIQPIPTLFRLLGLIPFKKVIFFHSFLKTRILFYVLFFSFSLFFFNCN